MRQPCTTTSTCYMVSQPDKMASYRPCLRRHAFAFAFACASGHAHEAPSDINGFSLLTSPSHQKRRLGSSRKADGQQGSKRKRKTHPKNRRCFICCFSTLTLYQASGTIDKELAHEQSKGNSIPCISLAVTLGAVRSLPQLRLYICLRSYLR